MTNKELINTVLAHQLIQAIDYLTLEKKTDAVKAFVPIAINEVATSYEWDFSTDIDTDVTVADQASYTLKGANNDCQSIINVYYNDTTLLEKLRPIEADEFMSDSTITGIGYWTPNGRSADGYPKIKIIATPGDAGENLTYRYFKKGVSLSDIPSQYDYVLVLGVLKGLFPDFKYQFDRAIKKMISHYSQNNNDSSVQRLDPFCRMQNNRAAGRQGW